MLELRDRVSRSVYLDDGTWVKLGDCCLPGPLKYGRVTEIRHHLDQGRYEITYKVRWDSGKFVDGYFEEGLKLEQGEDNGQAPNKAYPTK